MAVKSSGGGRAGRGGVTRHGGLNDPNISNSRRAALQSKVDALVTKDKQLYVARRTATPEQRASIDKQRADIAYRQEVLYSGAARANFLYGR